MHGGVSEAVYSNLTTCHPLSHSPRLSQSLRPPCRPSAAAIAARGGGANNGLTFTMRSALYPMEVADDTPSGGKSAAPTAKAAASGAGDLSKFSSDVVACLICFVDLSRTDVARAYDIYISGP